MKILANLIQGINSQELAILENWLQPVPNLRLLPSQTVLAEEVVPSGKLVKSILLSSTKIISDLPVLHIDLTRFHSSQSIFVARRGNAGTAGSVNGDFRLR